jgi:hypothetical protein
MQVVVSISNANDINLPLPTQALLAGDLLSRGKTLPWSWAKMVMVQNRAKILIDQF